MTRYSIGQFAKEIGVTPNYLRILHASGEFLPSHVSLKEHVIMMCLNSENGAKNLRVNYQQLDIVGYQPNLKMTIYKIKLKMSKHTCMLEAIRLK